MYTHCSGQNMVVHGCGVGAMDVADGGVEAPPSGREGMYIKSGRAWEDMYPLSRCGSGVASRGTFSVSEACVLIVDRVHARVLRSLHWPRRWILCRSESLVAAVPPMRNPFRASLTSADGEEGVSETYSMPLPGIPFWTRNGAYLGGWPCTGAAPGRECVVVGVDPLPLVKGMCSS